MGDSQNKHGEVSAADSLRTVHACGQPEMAMSPRKVKSNPGNELPINNIKYKQLCSEIHLADRGIDKIRGFEDFKCLEVLWLNNNKITALNHLDANFRIKFLYASNNKIGSLIGSSLRTLVNLEVLLLSNNQISDLDLQIVELVRLPFLRQLELAGNPLAEESNYRYFMIYAMPSLEILDRHAISQVERVEAAAKGREFKWHKKLRTAQKSKEPEGDPDGRAVSLKLRGPHMAAKTGPRRWRPRVFNTKMYHPDKVDPKPYRPDEPTLNELDLEHKTYGIRRSMAAADRARLKKLFVPHAKIKADFRADFAIGTHDIVTNYKQSFEEAFGETMKRKKGLRIKVPIASEIISPSKMSPLVPQSARRAAIDLDQQMWDKYNKIRPNSTCEMRNDKLML